MSIAIGSMGVKVYYVEAADTGIPSGEQNWIEVPEIKNIPSLSPAPDTLETTPLSNTEYKTYINGLKDLGGALEFTVNLTQSLIDMWNGKIGEEASSVIGKFNALTTGNCLWLAVVHPKLDQSVYFPFEPARLGLPEMSVNSVLEATLAITPIGEVEWGAKPTIAG